MKILLIGSNGRMGKQMQTYLNQEKIEYTAVDKSNFNISQNQDFDIIVDFSTADALKQNLDLALKKIKPILIATTNHNSKNEHMIERASKFIPIALCPNLSVGIMSVCKIIEHLKPVSNYDFVVEEIHHKNKTDSPSGTAKQLVEVLNKIGVSPSVNSVRAGSIVGTHIVTAYGINEVIEIKHTALSRTCFCEGAVAVCKQLINKKVGVYTIGDLLW